MIDTDKHEEWIAHMGKVQTIVEAQNKDLLAEVKRLRGLLNMIIDKALYEVNTQPNGDDSPYNTILNIAYEGVVE